MAARWFMRGWVAGCASIIAAGVALLMWEDWHMWHAVQRRRWEVNRRCP